MSKGRKYEELLRRLVVILRPRNDSKAACLSGYFVFQFEMIFSYLAFLYISVKYNVRKMESLDKKLLLVHKIIIMPEGELKGKYLISSQTQSWDRSNNNAGL
ncbi:hypothetical protein GQX74_009743 [Glossina fuscipes]|nr:hypothetical protein GQX74_009743 [Glossina fuscipes]